MVMLLLSLTACASGGSVGHQDNGLLLAGATVGEAQSSVVDVLEESGFTVEQRSSGEFVGSTGSGLAPDGYQELIACGHGGGDVAARVMLQGPGPDRPTGRFEVRAASSNEGARLTVVADFEARACVVERGRRTCEVVTCESTGLLEQRIMARVESPAESPTAARS